MAGSSSEWTEWISIYANPFDGAHERRGVAGSYAGDAEVQALMRDAAGSIYANQPGFPGDLYSTLRIASSVPCIPSAVLALCGLAGLGVVRRRERAKLENGDSGVDGRGGGPCCS
jgi:hypothetical protein